MKIYVFGNPLVKEDSLPLKILPKIKKYFPEIVFEVVDPNENFPPKGEKDLIIIDTVKGIKKPRILDLVELEKISLTPISPHDYDLMLHLQILRKLKKIDKIKIIGLPSLFDRNTLMQVGNIIKGILRLTALAQDDMETK
ncbi:hypothetical protein A3C98_05705 [Candidatus Roizmanbacteria bacterium RIFCSPHIGHO2_02_FULL_37_15]|uniref:Hydrogenase maturation protease n=1 Tax=Candidatus Roizmanbacteria bacterium RIFCSPLOWO2_01_FULL_37_16 TaxID=1802058 RepID=A0A1F7IPU3_9BACT|nr:MAG: hypothetical protein A2859_03645 [Candidatus Roizmanbacteria bacterium RIFCSPHIGHO2_01_FULL_37_16b]OGK21506.1 MAG: hypothetical protein A3C98_05705 [Candidatus Roizmanbacteria bacterium RIFCSPHIGHO2_02_FULL_37_15]OGK34144.1 MAG: hypothetical protein A3F57_00670 [Candidatus Roizmanbacteria bacterium RIFCSPHIGHO2_12_FULL_36_11]OGK45376.1 MAG: hypothetical protein A3B40_03445 [Candidatus Roizmanbacteria bacterium RIFCSPLOWO2_01_FULL_37_16]OGK55678.1 MAG: hypothetical protein A3I50_04035 [C